MAEIPPKSWWQYLGPGEAYGHPHMVVLVNNRSVHAWTDFEEDPKKKGYTWVGTREEFIQLFEPLEVEEEEQ